MCNFQPVILAIILLLFPCEQRRLYYIWVNDIRSEIYNCILSICKIVLTGLANNLGAVPNFVSQFSNWQIKASDATGQ